MSTVNTSRGLLLPCPTCGEEQATITLSLADCETLHCEDCGSDYTLDDVRSLIARWQRVLAWVEQAPRAE
jgi:uncharacterized Zn finger protein